MDLVSVFCRQITKEVVNFEKYLEVKNWWHGEVVQMLNEQDVEMKERTLENEVWDLND
jgi:Asp-tRNA(Asn)/Glu-tRNA(Gln) amidotransferase B subunit